MQEKEIEAKSVTIIEDSSENKYVFYQGNEVIGEIPMNSVIDHAEIVDVGGVTYLRLYFDASGERYVDIDLSELFVLDSFEDSETIEFTVDGGSGGRTITANIADGSIGLDKLASDFNDLLNNLATKDEVESVSAVTEYLNETKADKSELVWHKSEDENIFAEVRNDNDELVARLDKDGKLWLIVEGELTDVNDLLAQLANETYNGGDTFTP